MPIRVTAKTTRRRARAASVALCLLVAACGRGGPAATSTPGQPAPTGIAQASPTAAAGAPTATLAPIATEPPTTLPSSTPSPRTFTIGVAELPGSLDPANALDHSALIIVRHLYEGLTAYEPGGTRPVPALAESWLASPNALT